ncbi:MAG: DNA ligase D [Amphiplicatus sp.]
MARADALKAYQERRDFNASPEPRGKVKTTGGDLYIIQKHDATRLHFDFRLELDGVLKSWAVTKGPSLDPSVKRLAVRTEDHPVAYGGFEGVIPEGYGAGTVILWDRGRWTPKGDPREGLKKGALKFTLDGERLKGGFALIRMKAKKQEKRENWLLVKERDDKADPKTDPTKKWTTSVKSGRDLIATEKTGKAYIRGKTYKPGAKDKKTASEGGRAAPKFVPPQLATLRNAPPEGEGWLHEIKFDGYRIEAIIDRGKIRLITRNEKNWTHRYRPIAEALQAFPAENAVVDGELVAIDAKGHSNFGALQKADEGRAQLRYYAFDLLHLDGKSLRRLPLKERKARLKPLIEALAEPIFFSGHVEGDGTRVIRKACAMHLEGLVSKRANASYVSGRTKSWIKSKCIRTDEFVIAGYRKSDKRGRPFSSLLLGEYAGGDLVYRGRVGAGFGQETMKRLAARMKPLLRKTSAFASTPPEARRGAVWLDPSLVAQIAYAERTAEGRLRHPSFQGLREDKSSKEVDAMTSRSKDEPASVGGVRITHPDKVMYPEQGATKRAVAQYYFDQAARILPYLKGRPLSLVRCPDGREGQCFFQKHHKGSMPDALGAVAIKSKEGKDEPYLVIDDARGLVAAVQIGTLELHLWGARKDRIDRPERIVFDLDPDESLAFEDVKSAAFEVRDTLDAAGLQSFPLLTGGKGVHVIAPIERRREWDDIKTFCRGVARALERAAPERYVAAASKAKRKDRIFVDWLRNERGATAIAPYSTRARPKGPIATPVSWRELKTIDSAARFCLPNIAKRLSRLKSDPWEGYFETRQSIGEKALKMVSSA